MLSFSLEPGKSTGEDKSSHTFDLYTTHLPHPSSPRLLLYLRIPRKCDSVSSSHCVHLLTQIQLQSISTRPLLNLKIDPHPYCPSHFLSRSINYKHTFSHVNSLFFCCLPCPRSIQIAFFTLPDMKSFNFGQKQYLNQTFICPFIKTQPI